VLDYFASWAALAQYFSGVDFLDRASTPLELDALVASQVNPALGSPDAPTPAGELFIDALMRLTGGDRPYFAGGLSHQYGANFTVVAHAIELAGAAAAAAQNENTEYTLHPDAPIGSDQLNREVPRIASSPAYRNPTAFPEFQPPTGRIERPLLTLHGTGDLFVPISLEQSYAEAVRGAGREHLLVQRAIRRAGHCNFSAAERERAFSDLVSWVNTGVRAEGEDLSGSLLNVGLDFTKPLEPDDPTLP
jgi:pimeloyl-ACP methyl ester carboxylesterase